jgi:hypothetical protein
VPVKADLAFVAELATVIQTARTRAVLQASSPH